MLMSLSTNISFSNMFKEFRISANNCKKVVSSGGLYTIPTEIGLVFERSKSTKTTPIFLEKIFLVLKQMSFFI